MVSSDTHLRRLYLCTEEFRRTDPGMPTQYVSTFVSIALSPGALASDIADQNKMSESAISRHIRDLSDVIHKGKPGYNLIEQRDDPMDRRRKQLHLTAKGQRLVGRLLVIMEA